jgi:mannose-1-phosphate guanylyltransferase/phosphomannomutase
MSARVGFNNNMKAMILAAGEGTRMRPLTLETPKPLLPIDGFPLIGYILTWLNGHGISETAINICHLGDKIKRFIGDGSQFGMQVTYSEEISPLGTAGGVKKAASFFDGTFIVAYGDNLTDFDLSSMIRFHRQKKATATMALFKPQDPTQVGMIEMDKDRRISKLIEKPKTNAGISVLQSSGLANAAVYILEPQVLDYIDEGKVSDFAYDVFPRLIADGAPVYGYPLKPDDYFIDIGSIKNYQRVNEDVKSGKVKVKPRHG